MNSCREVCSVQKSPLKENEAEGRGGPESRPATGTDEPAGQKDGASDRHAAPNSLQESEPQTQPSLIPPCPPSPAQADHKNSTTIKQHCSSPTPPEDGSTSAKKTNDGSESAERNEKNTEKPKKAKCKRGWNFTIIDNNNNIDKVVLEDILTFIQDNFPFNKDKILSPNSNIENVENIFLEMLDKKTAEYINENKNKQHAFVFFKRKNKNKYIIDIKGPYEPGVENKNSKEIKHSEDFIIEEIEGLINDDLLEIWIYTLNNPCLGRKNHCPCMYNLIKFAERYPDLKMYIVFSEYYIFIKNINHFCKQAKKKITFDPQIGFKLINLDSEETCKVQNEKEAETSAELLSTPREKIKEGNENIEGIKSENKESVGLSEKEQLQYNQSVVLTFLNKLQGRYSNLEFFYLPFSLIQQWLQKNNKKN